MKKNDVFQFKKFTVSHKVNAQKVSTDSVLLGAWANLENAKTILDVGTGCGVLSLMAAQRYPEAKITAAEMDKEFYEEAVLNFRSGLFGSQIEAIHTDILKFERYNYFDHILCNPPYFTNSLLSDNVKKNKARHSENLSPDELFRKSEKLLKPDGRISLVFPYRNVSNVLASSGNFNFHTSRICEIRHTAKSEFSLVLAEFSRSKSKVKPEVLTIKNGQSFTKQYIELLQNFLTIF